MGDDQRERERERERERSTAVTSRLYRDLFFFFRVY